MASGGCRGNEPPAQTVRTRLGDEDVHKSIEQARRACEVDPAIVLGASGELADILLKL